MTHYAGLDISLEETAICIVDQTGRIVKEGEDPNAYDWMLTQVGIAVDPKDTVEWLWTKDVVDLVWEAQRLRRLRAALLIGARRKALYDILVAHDEPEDHSYLHDQRGDLLHAWSAGEPKALKRVEKILVKHGLNLDVLFAQALSNKLDDLDRIERIIANADARRNGVLREIERRRASLALRLRDASDQIIDAEVVDSPPDRPASERQ